MKGVLKDCSFGARLTLTAFAVVVGLLLTSCLLMFSPRFISLKWLQLIQTMLVFLMPALLVAFFVSKAPFSYLNIRSGKRWRISVDVCFLSISILPFINGLVVLNESIVLPTWLASVEQWMKTMEESALQLTEQFLSVSTWQGLAANLLIMAVVPAVGEEFFFRGLLQRLFSDKWGNHVAVWVSAFLFSTMHLQFYGFFPRMILGAMFGYLLLWTNSLWMPILAHFINNALAVVFFYLESNSYISFHIDDVGVGKYWWMAFASASVSLWLFFGIKNGCKKSDKNM